VGKQVFLRLPVASMMGFKLKKTLSTGVFNPFEYHYKTGIEGKSLFYLMSRREMHHAKT